MIVSADLRRTEAFASCSVDSLPAFSFGADAAPAELVFGEISSIGLRSDGLVAVLDRPARQLRVFNRAGTLQFSVGRAGEGPGEFGDPIAVLVIPGDSLVVWDWDLGRIVVFGPGGITARTETVHPPIGSPLASMLVTSSPRRYWLTGVLIDRLPRGDEFMSQDFALYSLDSTLRHRNPVARLRWRSFGWVDEAARQTGSPMFDPRSSVAGNDSLVFVADGSTPTIEVRGADWTIRRVLRWTEPSRAITPEVAAEFRRAFLARLEREVDRRVWEQTLNAVPLGDSIPTIAELVVGRDGTLAARRFQRRPGAPTEFLLFRPTGEFACVLTTPVSFRARALAADVMVGSELGDDGVPRVVGRTIRYRNQ
jgi:hypothetical protein